MVNSILIYEYQEPFPFMFLILCFIFLVGGVLIFRSTISLRMDGEVKPLHIAFEKMEDFQRSLKGLGVFLILVSLITLVPLLKIALHKAQYSENVIIIQGKIKQLHENDRIGYFNVDVNGTQFYFWKTRFLPGEGLAVNDSIQIEFIPNELDTDDGEITTINEVYKILLLGK